MDRLNFLWTSLANLLYPHHCHGCGTDVLEQEDVICLKCLHHLPLTDFGTKPNNPVEKIFYGRLNLFNATAAYYFTKDSLLQDLMIQLKYQKNKAVGYYLGKQLGFQLQQADRFRDVDALVPLPLNIKKEYKRGYNQAMVICEGIAAVWQKPILPGAVIRTQFTETQTKQDRIHRWQNMQHVFAIAQKNEICNKHLLLVDDVITTGATMEACGSILLQVPGTRLSLASVAWAI